MNLSALDLLRDAFSGLRAALDGDDIAALNAATARVRDAAMQVRASGAWHDEPALRERLTSLLPLIEAARIRVHFLSDQARRHMDLLAERGATAGPLTYRR